MNDQISNINEILCRFISNVILTLLDEEKNNIGELNVEESKLCNIKDKITEKLKEKKIDKKIQEYLIINYNVDSKHLIEIINNEYKKDDLENLRKIIKNYIEICNGDKYLLNDSAIIILNQIEAILEEVYFDISIDVISVREQWKKNITKYFEKEVKNLSEKTIKYENDIKVYKNDLLAYEDEIKNLDKLNDELYKEKNKLQNNLNYTSDKLKISEEKLKEINEKTFNMNLEFNIISEKNNNLSKEIVQMKIRMKALEKMEANANADEKIKAQYKKLNDKLNKENKSFEMKLNYSLNKLEINEEKLKQANEKIFNMDLEFNSISSENFKLKEEIIGLRKKIKSLQILKVNNYIDEKTKNEYEDSVSNYKKLLQKKEKELKEAFEVNFNEKDKIKELTMKLSTIKKQNEKEIEDLENEHEEALLEKEREVKKLLQRNFECKKIIEELEVNNDKFSNKEKEYIIKIKCLQKELNELNLKINNSIKVEKKAKILSMKEKIDIRIDVATVLSMLSSNMATIARTDKSLKISLKTEFNDFEEIKINLNNCVKEGNCIEISKNIQKIIKLVQKMTDKVKAYGLDLPNSSEDIIKDLKKIDNSVS